MERGIEKTREIAINIIDIFEGFLDDYDITIPSDDREGDEDEGRIFGDAYYRLEDEITEYLNKKLATSPVEFDK